MSYTNNISSLALTTLARKFNSLDLTEIAKKTGLIKRNTSKFSADGFLLSLLQAVSSGQGSLQNLVLQLSQILNCSLSRQGLHYRFKPEALLFLQEVSDSLYQLQAGSNKGSCFKRVLLQDSTQLRLPPKSSKHYKGIGNKWGPKGSAKIDMIKDAISGDLVHLSLDNGTKQDRVLARDLYEHLQAGDLVLRDMGYFISQGLQIIDQKKASFVSRVPSNTSINILHGPSIEEYLKHLPESQMEVDIEVEVSDSNPTRARLVALRCTEEVVNCRRAKMKLHRKRMGNTANKMSLEREGWTIYVTNLPTEQYCPSGIHHLYAQRWGIEIQFRALKGQTHLRELLDRVTKNKVHLSILLTAVMIFSQLTAKIHAHLKSKSKCRQGALLSIEKISSWFTSIIMRTTTLSQELLYDIRHLQHDKRRAKPQSIKAVSLF